MHKNMIQGMAVAIAVTAMFSANSALAKGKAKDGKEASCMGLNECKGNSSCKGGDHACKGQNECKGKGVTMMKSEKACTDKGGTVAIADTQ